MFVISDLQTVTQPAIFPKLLVVRLTFRQDQKSRIIRLLVISNFLKPFKNCDEVSVDNLWTDAASNFRQSFVRIEKRPKHLFFPIRFEYLNNHSVSNNYLGVSIPWDDQSTLTLLFFGHFYKYFMVNKY
jgi:hypothetical protein